MTERIRDRLIVNGEDLALLGYLAFPEQHPRITLCSPTDESPDESSAYFAACLGAYWSTWEIKDGGLWLIDIRGSLRMVGEEPLLATWITGTIRANQANGVHPHNGFAYRYEETMQIRVEEGVVQNSSIDVTVNNQGWALDSESWLKLYLRYESRLPGKDEI